MSMLSDMRDKALQHAEVAVSHESEGAVYAAFKHYRSAATILLSLSEQVKSTPLMEHYLRLSERYISRCYELQQGNPRENPLNPAEETKAFSIADGRGIQICRKDKYENGVVEPSDYEQIVDKILLAEADVNAYKMRDGKLSEEDWHKITIAFDETFNYKLKIIDTLSYFAEIVNKIRNLHRKGKCELVVIDYLSMISTYENFKTDNFLRQIKSLEKVIERIENHIHFFLYIYPFIENKFNKVEFIKRT